MAQKQNRSKLLALIAALFCAPYAAGGTPDWLQAAFREPLPQYAESTVAVMLRSEQITTLKNSGETTTVHRRAYKILRPEGRSYGAVRIYFDSETRVTSIKGWSLPAAGKAYEVGEKDSADAILFTGNLYDDARQKLLRIPAADPGSVIGYEYEQRSRPKIIEDRWWFQEAIPVRLARFELRMPAGWEFREFWANHGPVAPRSSGLTHVWELKDIPALEPESAMPAAQGSAGQLLLAYIPPEGNGSFKSWLQVGQWYAQLAADRREITSDIRQKVAELTAAAPTRLARMHALAAFVQQQVRYVAIEIGIGGFLPHPAQDIFKNRYGDCKDKATLLSAMLREIGVESYYVLINSQRGVVMKEFPSALVFDHAILAIRLPGDVAETGLYSSLKHEQMGSLLFFDPTDSYVPLGYLPDELQSSYGLVVGNAGGELIKLPLLPAAGNGLARTAKLELAVNGDLRGDVREARQGSPAFDFRSGWLNASESDRKKHVQSHVGPQTSAPELSAITITGMDQPASDAVLGYTVRLTRHATPAGGLLLLRPRLFREWTSDLMETSERKQPVEFPAAGLNTEIIEIKLPDGYIVDELPEQVHAVVGKAISYSSKAEVDGRILRYHRRLEINDVLVSKDQLAELKKFYRQIAAGEKASAVLRKQ